MGMFKKMAFGALAAAALALPAMPAHAQATPGYEAIIGSWNCGVSDAQTNMTVITTYHPDGRFISLGHSTGTVNGAQLEFSIIGEGSWNMSGAQLTEVASDFKMIFAKYGGQHVTPNDQLWGVMSNSMSNTVGTPNVRTVEGLNDQQLTVSYEGSPITCNRP